MLINFPGGLVPSAHTFGSIEFKNIMFSYPSRSESLIFNDLSLTVPPGQITAVVGSSGSGKSTLGSLLLRFYDPQKGELSPGYTYMEIYRYKIVRCIMSEKGNTKYCKVSSGIFHSRLHVHCLLTYKSC